MKNQDSVQLPETESDYHVRTSGIQQMLPTLSRQEAQKRVRAIADTVGSLGCRSAAELASRATVMREELGINLGEAEMRDAILFTLFGRAPVEEADRQQLVHVLVTESGGPVGEDADALPDGSGPFGRIIWNPVPVAGIVSADVYLGRLLTPDGLPLQWRRTGSQSNGHDGPVDCYELTDLLGRPQGLVYLSPYQQRVSRLAPEGLNLNG